jgi:hypothetical protein
MQMLIRSLQNTDPKTVMGKHPKVCTSRTDLQRVVPVPLRKNDTGERFGRLRSDESSEVASLAQALQG